MINKVSDAITERSLIVIKVAYRPHFYTSLIY